MELPKFQEKLKVIKQDHRYNTYHSCGEILVEGERLEDIPAKLTEIRKEIDDYKVSLMKHRSEIYNEVVKFLASKGLPEYEYTGKKMTKKTASYLDAINMKLSEKYRFSDYSLSNEMSTMEKYIKHTLDKRAKFEMEKKLEEEKNFRYQAILEFAKQYMTIEEIETAKELGTTIEQFEKLISTRYEKSQEEKTISISCCSECDSYTIGERRCSCGNRRISASAEIFFYNGKYHISMTTEAY